jgi:hypothetical protein
MTSLATIPDSVDDLPDCFEIAMSHDYAVTISTKQWIAEMEKFGRFKDAWLAAGGNAAGHNDPAIRATVWKFWR